MSLEDRWKRYRWRLIRGEPVDPPVNVAIDEVLTRRVGSGERPPTLRFWGRHKDEVVIGRFQSVSNEVNEEEARREGVEIIRRTTGGGAMFVEPGNIITFSIYAPLELVAGMSTVDSYAFLDEWVVEAFRSLGIEAYYEPINDISSKNGKIGGAAQGRAHGAVLHHDTLSYEIDTARMLRILRIGQEKLSDKAIQSAEKRVGPLRRQTSLPREEIIEHMIETFAGRNTADGLTEDTLTPEELAEAERLTRELYGTRDWIYSIP
ncbi:lipoate--protein ligase family protein [Rubrobacter calidifluminis]|uniref:lipoate--protein ligase family protein n=1 Tax=Rubrobacter calidifluminis TaxID=1392640 RepID=UPI00235E95C2|nr:biotin/lipoate A/B protein ligase family protein [Rubrobacter calidifluminis]